MSYTPDFLIDYADAKRLYLKLDKDERYLPENDGNNAMRNFLEMTEYYFDERQQKPVYLPIEYKGNKLIHYSWETTSRSYEMIDFLKKRKVYFVLSY